MITHLYRSSDSLVIFAFNNGDEVSPHHYTDYQTNRIDALNATNEKTKFIHFYKDEETGASMVRDVTRKDW